LRAAAGLGDPGAGGGASDRGGAEQHTGAAPASLPPPEQEDADALRARP